MVRVQLVEKLDYDKLEERIDKYIEDAINSNRQFTQSLDQLITIGLSEDSINETVFNIVKTSEEDTYISRKILEGFNYKYINIHVNNVFIILAFVVVFIPILSTFVVFLNVRHKFDETINLLNEVSYEK